MSKSKEKLRNVRVETTSLVDLEELFDADNWRSKAERLQVRRWREIKRQMV